MFVTSSNKKIIEEDLLLTLTSQRNLSGLVEVKKDYSVCGRANTYVCHCIHK